FFFQAEDGIRDFHVTGVQTCALPISGAIDLVYRDPEAGGLVVVDFKTDRIDGARALAERTAHHRAQALAYRRAIAQALGPGAAPDRKSVVEGKSGVPSGGAITHEYKR